MRLYLGELTFQPRQYREVGMRRVDLAPGVWLNIWEDGRVQLSTNQKHDLNIVKYINFPGDNGGSTVELSVERRDAGEQPLAG